MRPIVAQKFFDFTAAREGFTPFMYADKFNLITTGLGDLIDGGPRNMFIVNPQVMSKALTLPWKHKAQGWTSQKPVTDGVLASPDEIAACWTTTKLQAQKEPGFNTRSSGFAYRDLTNLTLDIPAIQSLFNRTLSDFNATLVSLYPKFESWPADAQLATLSMAWAMGPAFYPAYRPNRNAPAGPGNVPYYQGFKDAVDRLDFGTAADLSFFNGGGGIKSARTGRNAENVVMFHNADSVVKGGGDPNRLFFPAAASTVSGGGVGSSLSAPMGTAAKVGIGGAVGFGLYKLGKWWMSR